MTSPSGLTSILSIPFGPNDVFKRLATVRAAKILIYKNQILDKIIHFNRIYNIKLDLLSIHAINKI